MLFSNAGKTEYFISYTPSGIGTRTSPTPVIPRDVESNTLKSLGVNGKDTIPKPGMVISIVGAIGGEGYVDTSEIPSSLESYVGITNKSSFNVVGIFV